MGNDSIHRQSYFWHSNQQKSRESTRENVTGVNQFVLLPNLRAVYTWLFTAQGIDGGQEKGGHFHC